MIARESIVFVALLNGDPPPELGAAVILLVFALGVLVWGEWRVTVRRRRRAEARRLREDFIRRERLP